MIGLAWSMSLLWLAPITGWPYIFNNGVRFVPEDKCNTEYDKNIIFKVATAICNFYLPLIAMIALNTKIYLVIHKRYRNPIMRYSSISPSLLLAKKKYSNVSLSIGNDSVKLKPKTNENKKINSFSVSSFDYKNEQVNKVAIENIYKPKSFTSNSIVFFDSSEKNFFSKLKLSFFSPNSNTHINSISAPNLRLIKNDLSSHKIDSLGQLNFSKPSEIQSHRSVLSKLRANRRIPDDALKMSRLVHRESTSAQNETENNERVSPLFYRTPKTSIKSLVKCDEKKMIGKNEDLNVRNVNMHFRNGSSFLKRSQKSSIEKSYTGFSEAKLNRKGFMNKQEKAFKQLSAIVVGFTLCFMPYFIVFLIVAVCEDCISDEVYTVTLWLGYFNSTMNPFLYAMSNKRLNKNNSRNKPQLGELLNYNLNKRYNCNYNNEKATNSFMRTRKSLW